MSNNRLKKKDEGDHSVPQNVGEEGAYKVKKKAPTFVGRNFTDWVEERIKEHEEKGGFDNLPGKGKPIDPEYLKGDVLSGILKHHNVLPPWLELQHEIRDVITDLLAQIEHKDNIDIQHEISTINKKILHYNTMVPSILRKSASC